MGPDSVVFIVELILSAALMFLAVYYIICLSDLECDYLNAQACCKRLNMWVTPEVVGHAATTLLLVYGWHFWIVLLNIPLLSWLIYSVFRVPAGNMGKYDPTEIHNKNILKIFQREAFVKLACYLILFFVYLYSMIYALVKGY